MRRCTVCTLCSHDTSQLILKQMTTTTAAVVRATLLGAALRLDVDSTPDPGLGYKIPDDNPFVGEADSRGEIWAYGIRNIWRCDQDEGDPVTGALWGYA